MAHDIFRAPPTPCQSRWRPKPVPARVPPREQPNPLIRAEQLAATLRSKKKQEILKCRRDLLRYDTFEITSTSKFIRYGEAPKEIMDLLRQWKVVYAIRFDSKDGPFKDTTLLYIKEGKVVPKILKATRKHWVRVQGKFVKRDSEAGMRYLKDFRNNVFRDINKMFESLSMDVPDNVPS